MTLKSVSKIVSAYIAFRVWCKPIDFEVVVARARTDPQVRLYGQVILKFCLLMEETCTVTPSFVSRAVKSCQYHNARS